MERQEKARGGMTLIEVAVVLAIVSGLLGIAYSSLSRWQDQSTFTRYVETTLNFHIKAEQCVRSALRLYLQYNGSGGIWNPDSGSGFTSSLLG